MSLARTLCVAALACVCLSAATRSRASADPAAAAEQYRVARRLAAEGSPEARAALRKVIELDPDGLLADDALVEQALLDAAAVWPEMTGGLSPAATKRALELLDDVVVRFPDGDRVDQARYLRALLRLEPAATYDPSAARIDLTTVATSPSEWASPSRYGLAWLHEHAGNDARAFDAYQRLLVDEPGGSAGIRARVGAARVFLREGRFGPAAWQLQQAIESGVPTDARAEVLRELAVRSLRREAGAGDALRANRVRTGVRSLAGFAPTAAGGALLGDRKQGTVVELDADGLHVGEWSLDDLQAVAADASGRLFAAAGTTLYRLDRGRQPAPVASCGEFAPVGRMATDGFGGFWLLDRRGRAIGRIDPGQGGPSRFWEGQGARLVDLVWNGSRLVAIDAKTRGLVAIERNGASTPLIDRVAARPLALAADAAGRVALLDGRTGSVHFLRGAGDVETETFAPSEDLRPVAIGLGAEGELQLLDANGDWVVFR